MRELLRRLRHLFGRHRFESDLAEELEFHRAMRQRQLEASGMKPAQAKAAARRALGNVDVAKEHARDVWISPAFRGLWQDVRFAARSLAKDRTFTLAAVLALALGIGGTTAMFSAAYAALFQPLPFRDADRLVAILKKNPPRDWWRNNVSAAEVMAWRAQSPAFEDIAAYQGTGSCVLTGGDAAEEDPCERVSSSLFPLLGATPVAGRVFRPDEDARGAPPVAILSYGLWQRRFAADPHVVGRAIPVNGVVHTIVGVMPAGFSHGYSPNVTRPELWTAGIGLRADSVWNDYFAVGRLAPGADLAGAQAQTDAISRHLEATYPDLKGWRAQFFAFRELTAHDIRRPLYLLLGAVAFVLLIACANVASLMLARSAAQAGEIALRKALGADRWRIIRQLLTESVMLVLAGGALGLFVASWSLRGLLALAPAAFLSAAPQLSGAVLDPRTLLVALGTAAITTLLVGLAPAFFGARQDPAGRLREAERGTTRAASHRLRSTLVVAQISLAVVLLIGAGLMMRTLAALAGTDLGFNPANLLTLRVPFQGERYKDPARIEAFWTDVQQSVEAIPGVMSASVTRGLPVGGWAGQFFTTEDRPNPPPGQVPDANYVIVGSHYFQTLQLPLAAGRAFDDHDTAGSGPVAIVNEELARREWPGQNALGRRVRTGSPELGAGFPWRTIVGVARNVLAGGPDGDVRPELYVPYQQRPWLLQPQYLVVRAAPGVEIASLTPAVRSAIHRRDPDLPATHVATMEELGRLETGQQRMVMALLGGFAGVALVLAALGTYGVLAYAVTQRRREIGVRVALGAQRGDVLRLVTAGGARLTTIGIVLGVGGALMLTRLMTDLLFGVRPTDPLTYVLVSVLLGVISMVACYVPARRAMAVHPVEVLRHE